MSEFDLLSQSLSPLSSFACKAKLARFYDQAVNISCGKGSYLIIKFYEQKIQKAGIYARMPRYYTRYND